MLLGFTRACSYSGADAQAELQDACSRGALALGKQATFDDNGPAARITDVIFELDSGTILAYEFTTEGAGGAAFYLPASAVRGETPSALRFAPAAREQARPDLATLSADLAAEPPITADPGEFVTFEAFGEPDSAPDENLSS
jgi:hypothetical protein